MKTMVKITLITLLSALFIAGCSKTETENKATSVDLLKKHLAKTDPTIKVNPLAETYAGFEKDPARKKAIIEKAKSAYYEMNIKEIFLVTGTVDGKENVIGSVIQFKKFITPEEAETQLARDSFFKENKVDFIIKDNFALATTTINRKITTPEAIINAFKSYN